MHIHCCLCRIVSHKIAIVKEINRIVCWTVLGMRAPARGEEFREIKIIIIKNTPPPPKQKKGKLLAAQEGVPPRRHALKEHPWAEPASRDPRPLRCCCYPLTRVRTPPPACAHPSARPRSPGLSRDPRPPEGTSPSPVHAGGRGGSLSFQPNLAVSSSPVRCG